MVEGSLFMKILVIGDSTAGKTSILRRLCFNTFDENTNPTVGCDFCVKIINNVSKRDIRLQLWEIAGQDRYAAASKLYIRGALGCLVVTDITNPKGLESALRWRQIVMDGNGTFDSKNIPVIILQNKIDLLDTQSTPMEYQSEKYLQEFVDKNHFKMGFQVSAKTSNNIQEAVDYLVKEILKHDRSQEDSGRISRGLFEEDSVLKLNKYSFENTQRKSLLYQYGELNKKNGNCAC